MLENSFLSKFGERNFYFLFITFWFYIVNPNIHRIVDQKCPTSGPIKVAKEILQFKFEQHY